MSTSSDKGRARGGRGTRGGQGGRGYGERGPGSGIRGSGDRGSYNRGAGSSRIPHGSGPFRGAAERHGSDLFRQIARQPQVDSRAKSKPEVVKLTELGFDNTSELVPPPSLPPINSIKGTYDISVIANTLSVEISKPPWAKAIYKYDLTVTKIGGGRAVGNFRGRGRGRGGGAVGRDIPPGPPKVPSAVCGKVVKYLLGFWERGFKQPIYSDFKKFLITYSPLPKNIPNPVNFKMSEIGDEDETSNTGEYTGEICNLNTPHQIPFTPELERFFKDPQQFLESEDPACLPTTLDDLTQILNIVVRTRALRNSIGNPASNMIITPDVEGVEGSLVQWSGTSLRFTFGWLGFNTVNISAVIIGQPVLNALDDLWANNRYSESDPRDARSVDRRDLESANAFLTDCKIEYMRNGCKRKKIVKGVLGIGAQSHTFEVEGGRRSNVYEYFKATLNQKLEFPNGICLDIGNNCVLPAEACKIVRGQVLSKKVSDAQEKLPTAAERLDKIQNNIQKLKLEQDMGLRHCGINVAGKLFELKTVRVLPTPTLVYGSNSAYQQIEITPPNEGKTAGTWDMWRSNAKFHEPAEGQGPRKEIKWSIINITSRARNETADDRAAQEFGHSLKSVLGNGGLNILDFSSYEIIDSTRGNYGVELANKLTAAKQKGFDFVLVIMSGKEQYATIKAMAETSQKRIGVLTQCVYGKNVQKPPDKRIGIVQNIALKLNQKLGGTNYWLKLDRTWEKVDVLREPVLIIGADVTHPEKGSNFPSFAAVTASTDRSGMPYQVKIIVQETVQVGSAAEIIRGMAEIIREFIRKFIEATGHKPRKIFYYRDGVGDSQFGEVLQEEMMQIREGCRMAYRDGLLDDRLCWKDVELGESIGQMESYEPKITFVTVQKRHKVRFFWRQPGGGIGNIPPGTLVDTIVVNSRMTNFYLASHIGIQGTTIPTHYQVLWDDSDFKREELVILTYYLCFMFCRCTRSVSYPAPTYYSHLAATRAKVFATSLGRDFDYSDLAGLRVSIEREAGLMESFPMHFT